MMARKTAFIYSDSLSQHTLSETHPMKPVRLRYTYELLAGIWRVRSAERITGQPARRLER